eukprot:scaffold2975_cov135-Skeletonema_menzelii.AAC.2
MQMMQTNSLLANAQLPYREELSHISPSIAAVAALHLFIPSSHQQSKPRDATVANASATKIIPSFDGKGNTPSPPTLRDFQVYLPITIACHPISAYHAVALWEGRKFATK